MMVSFVEEVPTIENKSDPLIQVSSVVQNNQQELSILVKTSTYFLHFPNKKHKFYVK